MTAWVGLRLCEAVSVRFCGGIVSAWARVCMKHVVIRVGLFASGIAVAGAVGLRVEGAIAPVQGCGSARGYDVCGRSCVWLRGAVFCVWV